MKQYYILICLFVFSFNSHGQAAIGVQIYSWPDYISNIDWQHAPYEFTIKNIGSETLTNIYITSQYNITIFGTPIASLAPGEEDTTTFYGTEDFSNISPSDNPCDVQRNVIVHATTLAGTEITDLSSYNGNYNTDYPTPFTIYGTNLGCKIDSQYLDSNSNGIVDFGDKISYSYEIRGYYYGPNALISGGVIDNPNLGLTFFTNENYFFFFGNQYSTAFFYAYYNLTQEDIESGFVYLNPHPTIWSDNGSYCWHNQQFYDPTPCLDCPIPTNCADCIVTKLGNFESNKISGQVAFNPNNDNCDSGIGMANRKVIATSTGSTFATFTDNAGNYTIHTPVGTNSYNVTGNHGLNENFNTNPNAITISTSGSDNSYTDSNFCVGATNTFADLNVSLIPTTNARPGFDASYRINYYNSGTSVLNGEISFTYDSTKLNYIGSSIGVTQVPGLITMDYTELLPFEQGHLDIYFNVLPPPVVNDGDVLSFLLVGNPIEGDISPENNTCSINQIVTNSYDPNDKTVLEGAYISPQQALGYLNYVTRFQNTGSGEATTVVVTEGLDADLDWTTFEPLGASHTYIISIKNGNELTYTFNNIALPGMITNEPESHGWLAYRIKPKANFIVGDIASSMSRIFFDFNSPISTNTVTSQIDPNLSSINLEKSKITIAPNPVDDQIYIYDLDVTNTTQFVIYDNIGRIVIAQTKLENKMININHIESGIYFLNIKSDMKNYSLKFIKK